MELAVREIPRHELEIGEEVLRIKTSQNFVEKVRILADLDRVAAGIKVSSDEDDMMATDTVAAAKRTLAEMESMRKDVLSLPQKVVEAINGLMGPSSKIV